MSFTFEFRGEKMTKEKRIWMPLSLISHAALPVIYYKHYFWKIVCYSECSTAKEIWKDHKNKWYKTGLSNYNLVAEILVSVWPYWLHMCAFVWVHVWKWDWSDDSEGNWNRKRWHLLREEGCTASVSYMFVVFKRTWTKILEYYL